MLQVGWYDRILAVSQGYGTQGLCVDISTTPLRKFQVIASWCHAIVG